MSSLIITALYLLASFIPLIFTTVNYELFEFPKFLVLLAGTLTILCAWAIHLYTTRAPVSSLWRTIWHDQPRLKLVTLGMLAVLASQTLATAFSIHPYTSWWGYYSRFHQGLLTTLCYTIIYFAGFAFLDRRSVQKLLKISLATSLMVSLYAIAQRLGVDKSLWVQDVVNRPFSTLGQPNWLAAYLLPHLFILPYLAITKNIKSRQLFFLSFLILAAGFFVTKSRSAFISFFLAFPTYWLLSLRHFTFSRLRPLLISTSLALILGALLFGTAYTPSLWTLTAPAAPAPAPSETGGTILENGGITESGDIRKIVWQGALDLLKSKPILGTGVETFAYSYYWTRPEAHNYTSEWDFLYNKAHNEYLNYAATAGIVGLSAFLFWHFALARLSLTTMPKSKKTNRLPDDALRAYYPILGATLIGFTVTNFFGFSVIPVYFLLVLLAALPAGITRDGLDTPAPSGSLLMTSLFLAGLLVLIFPLRFYLADYYLAQGKAYLGVQQLETARIKLESARSLRPQEDLIRTYLAETYSQLAVQESTQEDPTALTRAGKLVELALSEISTTADHNPYHLNYLKSRTKSYLSLAELDPDYHRQAAQELERARSLAPSDPKLAYNLGLVYSRLDRLDDSMKQMEDAISLKTNYYEPYYALALLYESAGRQVELIQLLRQAQANFSPLPTPLADKAAEVL